LDVFLKEAAKIFPFIDREEQTRYTSRKIEKRHFKFFYKSPLTSKESHIILDAVFEDNYYLNTVMIEISNLLLEVEAPATYVTTPTVNCILGDKLTAFAPHTIGIPFGVNKELEVIKQHYDISILMEKFDNFTDVKNTYKRISEMEIEYRDIKALSYRETLIDSFNSAIAIIGKGKLFPDDYNFLRDGMRRIKGHIFDDYSPIVAEAQSCRIAYLIASVLADKEGLSTSFESPSYIERTITNSAYSKLNHVKKANVIDFAYLYEAIKMFEAVS